MLKGGLERDRRAVWVMASCAVLALVVGLVIGSAIADTDAARKRKGGTLWAVVAEDGSIVEGESKGVVSSATIGLGAYSIEFNRNVSKCAKLATLREFPGHIVTDGVIGLPRAVDVTIFNSNVSAREDRAFYLAANC